MKHSRSYDVGLTNNANRLKPYFTITVAVLIVFTTIYALKWNFRSENDGIPGKYFWKSCSKHRRNLCKDASALSSLNKGMVRIKERSKKVKIGENFQ